MTFDQYAPAVPFYDLWHEDGHVPEVREKLPPLVRGSVLEIGAGTGLITEVIADATDGEIFALEPSLGMRSVLLSRLAARPGLLERVTVLPYGALDVDLDEPVDMVVMIAVLYAIDDRPKLWETLARRLVPGGRLVFNFAERPMPVPGEPSRMAAYPVGRHTYEIWGRTHAVEGEKIEASFTYRIVHGDAVISEDVVESVTYRPSAATLRAELTEAGFVPDEAPEGLLAWRLAK
ncbi:MULTISPECIES: class I SAM-dependent methyltransferase [unclassified Nonomuraea]|uniref:class I SAM-dependent methyltransferase n=1 Tax=Nonomuraea sp. NPDC003804 TaxID=3154547 RepID=UPI0033A2858E